MVVGAGSGGGLPIQSVLERPTLGRRMGETTVEEQQVAIVEHSHIVLKAEAAEWVTDDRELVMPATQAPQHPPVDADGNPLDVPLSENRRVPFLTVTRSPSDMNPMCAMRICCLAPSLQRKMPDHQCGIGHFPIRACLATSVTRVVV